LFLSLIAGTGSTSQGVKFASSQGKVMGFYGFYGLALMMPDFQ
jgi:hypothetical protein